MRIRRKTLSTPERAVASNMEHHAIMEAIKNNDPDLAEKLATEHMYNAYDNMVKNGLYDLYNNDADDQNAKVSGQESKASKSQQQ